jgi:hypothetical protein
MLANSRKSEGTVNLTNTINLRIRKCTCRGQKDPLNFWGQVRGFAHRDRRRLEILLAGALLLLTPALAVAQGGAATPRITARVDENTLTVLRGNTHPLARPQNDQGAVADSQQLRRMLLLLKRAPDQEAALRQLLDQQQSSASPNFHQWLTPQQFGQQFGPADADVQAVTTWLQSHGFQIAKVSTGRTLVEFSGNAGQVRNAFHTEIHRYLVNGAQHLANNADPQIPAALALVVAGPVSLHNFPNKPLSRKLGVFRKTKATGKVTPLYTISSLNFCGATDCNALGPGDFAAIYNVQKLWTTGIGSPAHLIDGTGQTIAIVGDSEICTASMPHADFIDPNQCNSIDDVLQFRQLFGLPTANLPTVILDGPDPNLNPDELEGDLDVEWAGAVAKNATIDFVIAEQTETTFGTDIAAEYIVDNNLAPVMSESFGGCEVALGTNMNNFQATLWEQAAAQGITVVVSAGDSGSAGCDDFMTEMAADQNGNNFGPGVNGIASTPFNVAVGGTDFDITAANYQSTYWGPNSSIGGIFDVSALGRIPESTMNDSCAQNFTGALTGCSSLTGGGIFAGGGGQSNCVGQDNLGNCTTFYGKPSWQTLASGSGLTAANDITRDLPDISLFSADGFISNSFYIVCEADINPVPATCSLNAPYADFAGVGGTSAAAPTFAGIMALVNQEMTILHATNSQIPTRQGNANYVLYNLAAKQTATTCNSSATPLATCTFYDITKGNDSVPCVGGSFSCSNSSTTAGAFGVEEAMDFNTGALTGLPAWDAATGLDLATGLGSVNAFNLVNNWGGAVGAFTATTTTLCLSATATTTATCTPAAFTVPHGTPVYVNITVSPSPGSATSTKAEDVSLIGSGSSVAGVDYFTSNNYVLSNSDTYPLTSGSASGITTNNLVGGAYKVIAHYTGDGTFGASDSAASPLITVNPEGSTAKQCIMVFNPTSGLVTVGSITLPPYSCTNATQAPYGDVVFIRTDVFGATSGQGNATGTVVLSDNGVAGIPDSIGVITTNYALNTEGYSEDQTNFLAVGTHSFQAKYNGDPSYNPMASPSTAVSFTITKAPTTAAISANNNSVAPNTDITFTAIVDTQSATNPSGGSLGAAPSGTVKFFTGDGATQIGTATLQPVVGGDSNGFAESLITFTTQLSTPGTLDVTYVYSGDANYATSTSSPLAITVTGGPIISVTSATNPIPISAPGQMGTSLITVNGSSITNADNVTLTCAVTASPAGTDYDPPTCSFGTPDTNFSAPNVINLTAANMTGTATMTVFTTPVTARVNPLRSPRGPNWFLMSEVGAFIACFFLLGILRQKRRSVVLLAMLLFAVLAVGTGCGSSYGGGGGGGGNPGTTIGAYTITVTATPASGAAQTTTVMVNVQ